MVRSVKLSPRFQTSHDPVSCVGFMNMAMLRNCSGIFSCLGFMPRSAISEWRSAEQTGDYQRVLDRFTRSEINKGLELILQKVPGIKLPVLKLQPRNLADAMGIQFAQAISGIFNMQKCPSCPSWFVYGTGTGRRASRTYCSDRCKQAAYRRARDKKTEAQSGGE